MRAAIALVLFAATACGPPRKCVDALDAYSRATNAAPYDETDPAYDEFVRLAGDIPDGSDGKCAAAVELRKRVQGVRAEKERSRAAALASVTPEADSKHDGGVVEVQTRTQTQMPEAEMEKRISRRSSFSWESGVAYPKEEAAPLDAAAAERVARCTETCDREGLQCDKGCDQYKWQVEGGRKQGAAASAESARKQWEGCLNRCAAVKHDCRSSCTPRKNVPATAPSP